MYSLIIRIQKISLINFINNNCISFFMRKSAVLQSGSYRQQDQQQSSQQQQNEEFEFETKKKKQIAIPRFIKNQIDEIDTQVILFPNQGTQYEVVQQVAKQLGWQVQRSKKSQKWDIMWIDSHIEAHDLFRLNQHQKISHFPAIYVLTRKNFLGRSLMKMRNFFPQQYNFFPSTWSIPADFTQLLRFDEKLDKSENNQFYIYKPQALAQGKGIKLVQNVQLLQGKNGIVQKYINNPYLIQNLKFDLRIYVLILGYDPLRIFIYDQGLGRFATQKYQKVKKKNMKDVHMHLTNYAINKNNKNFIFNQSQKAMDKGHKRSLSAIYSYLTSKQIDVSQLKKKIDEMIIKTLIVGQPMIAHTYGLAQSDNNLNDLCFQILGFDVLINEDLQPILLQVNHTPSFKTDTPLDKFIKKKLIKDTLVLLNVNIQNKKEKIELKKQFIQLRSQRKLVKLSAQEKQQLKKKKAIERDDYEMQHLGNFRKIFPTEESIKYKQMIEISNKIFNQANGIKNKAPINKASHTVRPKSFEKSKQGQTSQLLTMMKQKITLNGLQNHNFSLKLKDIKSQNSREQISKFPKIISSNKREKNRVFSEYLMNSSKNEIPKHVGIHKLQRTNSDRKKSKPDNIQLLQNDLYCIKGSFLPQKIIEMEQISHKSTQNSPNIIYSNLNVGNKVTTFTKIKKFQQIANQACIHISSLSPSKATYQQLLTSLSLSSSGHNPKEQFVKLKPIRKF